MKGRRPTLDPLTTYFRPEGFHHIHSTSCGHSSEFPNKCTPLPALELKTFHKSFDEVRSDTPPPQCWQGSAHPPPPASCRASLSVGEGKVTARLPSPILHWKAIL